MLGEYVCLIVGNFVTEKIKRIVGYFCFFLVIISIPVVAMAIIATIDTPMISMFKLGVGAVTLPVGLGLSAVLFG